ncbi:hypothetical protein GJAV_G00071920 [Gymnothorax javanicus]|nr:hypothetical protein GJAV_G00071920 [Gymnothorax javanicus]
MDSADYTGVVLGSRLIKSEDTEETIQENNGCGIKVEKVIISNVKEEEEEGGEKQSDEVKREDGVKDEEECDMEESLETDGMLKERSHSKQQEEERSSPLVISSRGKNADIASPGSPSISSIEFSTGESEAFACSQCPFLHMEKDMLHQHMKKVHAEEHCRILGYVGNGAANPLLPCSTNRHPTPPTTVATLTQPNTGARPYQCSLCEQTFNHPSSLKSHQRRHSEERPYQCSQCEKSFRFAWDLTVHLRIHTGERPYQCSQCGETFRKSSSLSSHQRRHTGVRPYQCSKCDKAYRYSSNLTAHQRVHSKESP